MKLYELFHDRGFHTVLTTSFGVDFEAFESIAVNRLRTAECRNVVLVCDAGMLGLSLADRPPKSAGANYLVVKARASSGVFHPKLTIQLGKTAGRLVVASANATASGYAGNLELVAKIDCTADDSGERRLVLAALKYGLRFLDVRQVAVEDKLRWAADRTPWLNLDAAADGPVELSDGTRAALLTSGGAQGIAAGFLDLVEARRAVERLVVVSPYWDDDLSSLAFLKAAFRPHRTIVLVDTERKLFPAKALRDRGTQVSELRGFDKKHFPKKNTRFVHAKMIVVTAGGADHVLMGSPNCTFAALGDARKPGTNEEAALYRRLPKDRIFEELDLQPLLEKSAAVDVKKIPAPTRGQNLPLAQAMANDPGTFELAFDKLSWTPGTPSLLEEVLDGRAALEMLDSAATPIRSKIEHLPDRGGGVAFHLGRTDKRPAFARFRRPGGKTTGLAIVAAIEELRTRTRDPLTAKAERALHDLEIGDEDEGLWLYDDLLALAPQPGQTDGARTQRRRRREEQSVPAGDLDYAGFMRGRRRRISPSEEDRDALSGTHMASVRTTLNKLLGLIAPGSPGPANEEEEEDVSAALDTGDEVPDEGDALEEGFEPEERKRQRKTEAERIARRRQSDADAIEDTVHAFTEDMREPDRIVDAVDMLKVRTLLAIVARAGWPGKSAPDCRPSATQVLPCSDEHGGPTWPRLMGMILGVVFQGPRPALARMRFGRIDDRLSDDVLEAWAHCAWGAYAAVAAAKADPACKTLVPFLVPLVDSIEKLLMLSPEERATPSFAGTLERLDERFRRRLRIGPVRPACMADPAI